MPLAQQGGARDLKESTDHGLRRRNAGMGVGRILLIIRQISIGAAIGSDKDCSSGDAFPVGGTDTLRGCGPCLLLQGFGIRQGWKGLYLLLWCRCWESDSLFVTSFGGKDDLKGRRGQCSC